MNDKKKFRLKGRLIYFLITSAASAALLVLSRRLPGLGEWYARHIFPVFPHTLGRLAGKAPVSVFEAVILGLAVTLPLLLLWGLGTLFRGRRRDAWGNETPAKPLARRFLNLCCLAGTLFLLFVLTCGVNYNRDTFARQAGLEIRASDTGELRQLYRLLAAQVSGMDGVAGEEEGSGGTAAEPANANGPAGQDQAAVSAPAAAMDNRYLNDTARAAMTALSADYEGLVSYYPPAKPVYFSKALSFCQLAGFYSCFTMEANYNRDMPDTNKPFTICHELAHISGFAREDEANFAGYLACLRSGEEAFRYSGALQSIPYVLNALYGSVDAEEYQKLYELLPVRVRQDMEKNRIYWQSFEGRTSEIYQAANDSYLKANNQEDGLKSYGRMVDLLLAYYRDNGELELYPAGREPVLPEVRIDPAALYSTNAVLADRETGTVLFSKAGGDRAEPASVTKILTAVTAIGMIEDIDATVTMGPADFAGLKEADASVSGFKEGERVSYRDLLYTLMLISGCDSAYALANNLSGSIPAFAERMNEKAAELGLSGSHFVDPSGLTAPGHYTTAEDTVKILDYALKNPLFRQIFEAGSYSVPATNLTPEAREINNFYFSRLNRDFEGQQPENVRLLGGKTGFTNAAGLCLATLGEFDGREYIAVIFGGPGNNRTPQFNFMDALTLFGAM